MKEESKTVGNMYVEKQLKSQSNEYLSGKGFLCSCFQAEVYQDHDSLSSHIELLLSASKADKAQIFP